MSQSFFQISTSWWWAVLVVMLAAGLAIWRYTIRKKPWNSTQNLILAVIHFFAVLMVSFMLLQPKIHRITYDKIFPTFSIAVDNSSSVIVNQDSSQLKATVQELTTFLEKKNLQVTLQTFNENTSTDSLHFDAQTSNLGELVAKSTNTEDEHFVGSIFLSDGIFNQGTSPYYQRFKQPVYTVGLGDTTQKKDLFISRVRCNKVSFLGNKAPLKVELNHTDYYGNKVVVTIKNEGKTIDSKPVLLSKKLHEVDFLVPMNKKGINQLSISVSRQPTEANYSNNTKKVVVEVIDDQHKVLIVAAAPHPDIKAIKMALGDKKNFEIKTYIPSIHQKIPKENIDVLILHNFLPSQIPFKVNDKTGIFSFINPRVSDRLLAKNFPFLKVKKTSNQPDKVAGIGNVNFRKFEIGDLSFFENAPPVEVPYGNYKLGGGSEVLMYQKLGSAQTGKPLMVYNDNGAKKTAIWLGQGFWKWRMQEVAVEEDAKRFDELIAKTVQYLSLKNDKKQFLFKPTKRVFSTYEPPTFETEVYNDNYERVYGDVIDIKITGENGYAQIFSFSSFVDQSLFELPLLKAGSYTYRAGVKVGDKSFTEKGTFFIREINLEKENTTANHQLMRLVANKSKGEFFKFEEVEKLKELLNKKEFKPLLKSKEKDIPLKGLWWWYLIIFLLFSTEWFLRKYWGGY